MNTKSLLTKIAVPVLGLSLLGGIGATLATSASAATVPAVSAYFYNPSGNALGGPQAMPGGTLTLSPSQYLAKVTEPMHNADLTGQTVTITGTVNASGLSYQGSPTPGTSPDSFARVYFQGAGGTSTDSPLGYEGQSWWSNPVSVDLNTNGTFSLTVAVGPSGWSDWNGQQASGNADLFNHAASHVRELGLSFGGGYFFENGVDGSGTLTITSITTTTTS